MNPERLAEIRARLCPYEPFASALTSHAPTDIADLLAEVDRQAEVIEALNYDLTQTREELRLHRRLAPS